MKKPCIPGVVAAALLALGPAPAAGQSRVERQMMADLRILQEQAQQLSIAVSSLNEALKALNGRLDQQDEAMRRSFADQRLIVDNIGADLRVIRDRTDETNVRINTLSHEMDALRNTIAQMQVFGAGAAPVDPGAPDAAGSGGAPTMPSAVGVSPTRMYETAFADYAAGQWSLAISGFEAFLKTFPKSELADDAQLGIGDTYFASGRFAEATAAYNQVIQNYAGSNSVPQAYYKRGAAEDRLGQTDAARTSWEFVVKTYPDSDAGRLAKQNLDRLGNRKSGGE